MSSRTRGAVDDFLRALLALATVGGAYWGAAALDLVWVFWLLVGGAVLFAIARALWPAVRNRIVGARVTYASGKKYPQLLKSAGAWEVEAKKLRAELDIANVRDDEIRALGILEGRRRVIGEIRAGWNGTALAPVAIGLDDVGRLAIAAAYDLSAPERGGLWLLKVRGVGAVKAMLRVEDVLEAESQVLLVVDHAIDAPYIEALSTQAATSSDFPSSLEIVSRRASHVTELEQEA